MEKINIETAKKIIKTRFNELRKAEEGENLGLMFWGAPGIGKTAAVKQAGKELGVEVKLIPLSALDLADLNGVPFPDYEKQKTVFMRTDLIPTEEDGKEGILFIDEINTVPEEKQARGLYGFVFEGFAVTHKIGKNWLRIAAGNLPEHTAVFYDLAEPLQNRFEHYRVEPDLDAFIKYALERNISYQIIAFLKFKPEYLLKQSSKEDDYAWPSPRVWEYGADRALKGPKELMESRVRASVGEAAGMEFLEFLKVSEQLRPPEEVLRTKRIPQEISARLATIYSVVSYVKREVEKANVTRKKTLISELIHLASFLGEEDPKLGTLILKTAKDEGKIKLSLAPEALRELPKQLQGIYLNDESLFKEAAQEI